MQFSSGNYKAAAASSGVGGRVAENRSTTATDVVAPLPSNYPRADQDRDSTPTPLVPLSEELGALAASTTAGDRTRPDNRSSAACRRRARDGRTDGQTDRDQPVRQLFISANQSAARAREELGAVRKGLPICRITVERRGRPRRHLLPWKRPQQPGDLLVSSFISAVD